MVEFSTKIFHGRQEINGDEREEEKRERERSRQASAAFIIANSSWKARSEHKIQVTIMENAVAEGCCGQWMALNADLVYMNFLRGFNVIFFLPSLI